MQRSSVACLLFAAAHASASPAVVLEPSRAKPGDAVLVTVRGEGSAPRGSLAGQELEFYPSPAGFRAIGALPLEQQTGPLTVQLEAGGAVGAPTQVSALLEVIEPAFRERSLRVAQRFVEPSAEDRARRAEDQAVFARVFSSSAKAPLFSRPFAWPRPLPITGRFGDRRVLNGELASQHYGVDFPGKIGAVVRAANDGRVRLVRDCYASGLTVVLDHGAELFSLYFHLSRALVKGDEWVKRGTPLGRMGASGRVTGPHLHFAVRVKDRYVDPASVMRLPLVRRYAPFAAGVRD